MKTTPFILFIILLLVLVIFVVFGYRAKEGFVNFQYKQNSLNYVWIPPYTKNASSPTVVKLVDNMFFDTKNGNLIEVDSSPMGNVSTTDTTGATLTKVTVTQRSKPDTQTSYSSFTGNVNITGQDTTDSLVASLPTSYSSYVNVSSSSNTDTYTTFYMPWADSTYIHMIDNTTTKNVGTFCFGPANTMDIIENTTAVSITGYTKDTDASTNSFVIDNYYDTSRKLYQLGHYVKFDAANGNLIIQTG